jgi:hypothetical protein
LESPRGCDNVEPGQHRALGVVLVGTWKAEIGQNAVAHELGNDAVISGEIESTRNSE